MSLVAWILVAGALAVHYIALYWLIAYGVRHGIEIALDNHTEPLERPK